MTGATPKTDPMAALRDLQDAINTIAFIFEAADALVYDVSRNIIAMETCRPGLKLGPVSGMCWAMGELNAAIISAKTLVENAMGARPRHSDLG